MSEDGMGLIWDLTSGALTPLSFPHNNWNPTGRTSVARMLPGLTKPSGRWLAHLRRRQRS